MAQIAITDKCDLCEVEDNVDFFCVNCDEILCANCKFLHSKSRATRNHQILRLSQAREENIVHKSTPVFCHEHSTMEVTLFCLKCDELICTKCVAGKHSRHNITSPDEIKDSKAEELNRNITKLKGKQIGYVYAFYIEGQIHSQFTKSIEQARKDISDQKAKIIEELDKVCYEQNAELTKHQQNENKRYSDKCNEIQAQNQTVTSAIQTAEKTIESSSTALIMEATVDTTNILDGLQDIPMTQATTAKYQPGDRSQPTIRGIQGKVNIEQAAITHQPGDRNYPAIPQVLTEQQGAKPKLRTDVLKVNLQEKGASDSIKQKHSVKKPSINVNKVRVKSTIKVNDKGSIYVIVPLKNKTAWVKAMGDQQLSLVDSKGTILTTSVTLLDKICDAKEYSDGLLVTYYNNCNVIKMSSDGQSISTFSDLSPYKPKGLCVTQDMEVLLCLRSTEEESNNKVVRLNSEGDIIQTIQQDATGTPLYKNPRNVTSLTTGEVIVVDWSEPRRIIGVDSQGQHLLTWEGETQGKKLDQYNLNYITRDSNNNLFVTDYNNDRVYVVLEKDGSGAMCVLDRKHGIYGPVAVAVDNEGHLWVGCSEGRIHIVEFEY